MDPTRPWWADPWLWVCVSAVFLVLGIFVWPGLLGGALIVVPLLWIGRRPRRRVDPRSNGHGRSEDVRRLE